MRASLVALALALSLTACQSDDSVEGAPPSEAGPVAPPEPIASAAPATRLDVNTATAEQLATIPGVGDRMVHEFEEYRPYASIQQFRREIGKYVDEDVVAGYEDHLFVPVRPNESDAETLAQLPGVDIAVAQTLIAGRPYASQAAFLSAYEEIARDADVEAASALLGSE